MNFLKRQIGRYVPYNYVKTPVIIQATETECGAAALTSLMQYYGINVSLNQLRDLCGASRDGTHASTLLKVASQFDFQAEAYKMSVESVSILSNPVIAFWNFNHYIIINGFGYNKVYINDPAHGQMSVTLDQFAKSFTGVIINLVPNNPNIQKRVNDKPFKLNKIDIRMSEQKMLVILLMIIGIWTFMNASTTYLFMNKIVLNDKLEWRLIIITMFIITTIIYISSSILAKLQLLKSSLKSTLIQCLDFSLHALKLPVQFYMLRQKSDIVLAFTRLDTVINNLIFDNLNLLVNTVLVALCSVALLAIDFRLAALTLTLIIIMLVISNFTSAVIAERNQSSMFQNGKIYSLTLSTFKNYETIKSTSLESSIVFNWKNLLTGKLNREYDVGKIGSMHSAFNKIAAIYYTLLIIVIGLINQISLDALIAFYMLYGLMNKFSQDLYSNLHQIKSNRKLYSAIEGVLEYPHDARYQNPSQTRQDTICNNEVISIESVSYSPSLSSSSILNNISLKINNNSHIAIVGSSGSGKSTLLKLICGSGKVTSGEINIFGRNVQSYHPDDLSSLLGYLPQNPYLFTGTLLDNVKMFNPDVSLSTIRDVLDICNLTELVRERGLSAKVQEGGRNFSGGERQRIELARVLLQNAPILLLDEPTSALDQATEMKIIRNLRNLNKTIIFIAHRLASIKHCDNIIVLDNASIVEQGTHADLSIISGIYHDLYKRQQLDASF